MRQLLREEQDMAYAESLKADKEKEKRREEEKRQREAAEAERLRKEQEAAARRKRLEDLRKTLMERLPPEPAVNSADLIRLLIKLPNGKRLERRFLRSDPVKYLFYFVHSNEESPLLFAITSNFPSRDIPGKPDFLDLEFEGDNLDDNDQRYNQTLENVGLQKSEILFVRDLEA